MIPSPYPKSTRWLIIAPALFLLVFLAIPTAVLVQRGASADAFLNIISGPSFRRVAWFTLWQTMLSTVLTVACALPVTFILSRFSFTGKRLLLALITAPFLLPTVVVGTALFALLPTQMHYTAVAIIIAHVFFNMAVVVRLVMPRWSQIDPELIHAAHTLGASTVHAFRTITFPLIRPALSFASTAVALFCFTSFGAVRILGGPAYSTLETEIYVRSVQLGDLNGAIAIGIIQTVFLAGVLYAWTKFGRHHTSPLTVNVQAPRPTRATETALVASIATITGVLALLPFIAVAWKSASGWSDVLSQDTVNALLVSARFAITASIIATTLGTMIALAISYKSTSSQLLETITSLPLMISAVTVGLGILITFDHSPFEFRSTWWITPVAHSLIAIPLVVRTVLPVAQAIPQDLRDAAATLGSSSKDQWIRIDLPLLRRCLATASALSAAVSLGEFGATSFLTRQTYETLPVSIARLLSRPGDTQHAQAFALSTLFFVFSIGAVYVAETMRATRTKTH
jgi:thiamine transport system permease protein